MWKELCLEKWIKYESTFMQQQGHKFFHLNFPISICIHLFKNLLDLLSCLFIVIEKGHNFIYSYVTTVISV